MSVCPTSDKMVFKTNRAAAAERRDNRQFSSKKRSEQIVIAEKKSCQLSESACVLQSVTVKSKRLNLFGKHGAAAAALSRKNMGKSAAARKVPMTTGTQCFVVCPSAWEPHVRVMSRSIDD